MVGDIGDAVDFIQGRTGADKVNLVGWSWGAVTTGMYTASHNDKVDRLVFYAPIYSEEERAWVERMAVPGDLEQMKDVGAYRSVNAEQAADIWEEQIVPADKAEWREEEVFETWFEALSDGRPEGADVVRAPNGVLVELLEIHHARPVYDASQIKVPTLVIRARCRPESTLRGRAWPVREAGRRGEAVRHDRRRHPLHQPREACAATDRAGAGLPRALKSGAVSICAASLRAEPSQHAVLGAGHPGAHPLDLLEIEPAAT